MKIGVYGNSYTEDRLIIDKNEDMEYVKLKNHKSLIHLIYRVIGRLFPAFKGTDIYAHPIIFSYQNKSLKEIDVVHTFNRVCDVNTNWVVTVEKTLPVYFYIESNLNCQEMHRKMLPLLEDTCLSLLTISEWAYKYQSNFLKRISSEEEYRILMAKTQVLYPPQQLLIEKDWDKKFENISSEIRFLFVGRQMWRKGGVNVLKALVKLSNQYPIKLTLIGKLNCEFKEYIADKSCIKEVERILDENRSWIQYYSELSNNEVLGIMKKSHVGLLPTIGDTFGYSVLEMQAAGVPVITTNREALNEINSSEIGWLIDTKQILIKNGDDYGHYNREEIIKLSDYIDSVLPSIIIDIFQNPDCIRKKAVKCIEKISRQHSPEKYGKAISEIYKKGKV